MATVRRLDPSARIAVAIAFALMTSFAAVMTMPRPVLACSCVGFTSWKEAVTPDSVVFTGTAGPRDARGVPVRVAQWFFGAGAAPTVWLSGQSFNGNPGVSNSCGIDAPPEGSSWLWVAYRGHDDDLGTGLCSPAADLATAAGKAMLTEAQAAFGDVPIPPEETAAPTSEAPLPTPVAGPADVARDQAAVTTLGLLLLGSLALFGGIILVARRSRRGERR